MVFIATHTSAINNPEWGLKVGTPLMIIEENDDEWKIWDAIFNALTDCNTYMLSNGRTKWLSPNEVTAINNN
jgi:hypothetical protein